MAVMVRREYGTGSVYERKDGRWVGTIEVGFTARGTRRRITVTASSEPSAKRKLRDRRKVIEREGLPAGGKQATISEWSAIYLPLRERDLSPKAYAATASAYRRHIEPAIGHRKIATLTPADIRKVMDHVRDHPARGEKASVAHVAAVRRTLMTMLKTALAEGHPVPQQALMVKPPKKPKVGTGSDRMDVPLIDAVRILQHAARLPHGTRWAFALLHGMRQGECLGLTWDAVDLERDIVTVEWQLQALPYLDRANRAAGFRVPDDYDCRHLVNAFHLVRPKSSKGFREIPLIPAMRTALVDWREVAPANPWGLVWANAAGKPANSKHDLAEWHALQGSAEVGHPGGRYFHVHECRNLTATLLDQSGASDNVITSLLGHASILTSRGYMGSDDQGKRAAIEALGERLLTPLVAAVGTPSQTGAGT